MEKLKKAPSWKAFLIPKEIEDFAQRNPNIICNELTKEVATAIVNKDLLLFQAMTALGGLINDSVFNLLKNVAKKGDSLLVHHYHSKSYFTSVVKLNYISSDLMIYEPPKGYIKLCEEHSGRIELSNIIAVAKIPETKKIAARYLLDNDQSIFLQIARKFSKAN